MTRQKLRLVDFIERGFLSLFLFLFVFVFVFLSFSLIIIITCLLFLLQKEFIREVEMGPFKHTVDDGLDIRKVAYECMYTLLDSCLDKIDIFEFLNHVEDGLRDHYDIKMLTYLMLVRLSVLCPSAVLNSKFSVVSISKF